jgi:hypothetical protein
LRADLAADLPLTGCRILTTPASPGGRPFRLLGEYDDDGLSTTNPAPGAGGEPLKLRPWESVGAAYADQNEKLAGMLRLGLQEAFPGLPVRRARWPVAFLEGLDTAGLVLYVGEIPRSGNFRQEKTAHRLGWALARAVGSLLKSPRI